MATVQQIIDLARVTLNDDEKTRWPDAECLRYAKDAYDAVFQVRPDLYLGQYVTFDAEDLALSSVSPIESRYRRQIADYIVMRCETKDDESVNNNRAALANTFFKDHL